jgi:hypothetical protein
MFRQTRDTDRHYRLSSGNHYFLRTTKWHFLPWSYNMSKMSTSTHGRIQPSSTGFGRGYLCTLLVLHTGPNIDKTNGPDTN